MSLEHAPQKANARKVADFEPLLAPVPVMARILGISESTTWRYIRDGKIETVKVGGRRLGKMTSVRRMAEHGADCPKLAPEAA